MIKRIHACPPEKKHAIFYCRLITVEPQLYKTGAVQACVLYSYPSRQNHLALPQQICSLSEYCSVVCPDMSIPKCRHSLLQRILPSAIHYHAYSTARPLHSTAESSRVRLRWRKLLKPPIFSYQFPAHFPSWTYSPSKLQK